MTDTPDTSPEAVERFSYSGMRIDDDGLWVRYSDYAARAEAAEAERDALKAELAEAVVARDDARVRALVDAARKVNDSYWYASDGVISGIYELEAALRALERG